MSLLTPFGPKKSKQLKELESVYKTGGDKAVRQYLDTLSSSIIQQLAKEIYLLSIDKVQQQAIVAMLKEMEDEEIFLGFSKN